MEIAFRALQAFLIVLEIQNKIVLLALLPVTLAL
jgi:hypothetical protein